MSRLLFGTDGIRGIANQFPMDIDTCMKLGRVLGYWIRQNCELESPWVCIAKDSRISGDMIQSACIAGLCASGVNVRLLGVVPTPAVALLIKKHQANAGIMISASHNPFADNGIKIFDHQGFKLSDQQEEIFETWIRTEIWQQLVIPPEQVGRTIVDSSAVDDYMQSITQVLSSATLNGMKIAIDCAHGASAHFTQSYLQKLGAEVHAIGIAPNGVNINQNCGATHPENLATWMRQSGEHFDLGVCLDGDADRCILIDEKGEILTGDHILYIFAVWLCAQHRLPDHRVVVTQMSNLGLDHALQVHGISLERVGVGDRYVTACMRQKGLNLGGEQSGHLIIHDLNVTGDALLAAFVMMNIMQQTKQKLSILAEPMHMLPQVLNSFKVAFKPKLEDLHATQAMVQQVTQELAGQGRVLLRYSGTEAKARVMIEGQDLKHIENHCHTLSECMLQEINQLFRKIDLGD